MTVATAKYFEEIFRESLVIEIVWEDTIDCVIDDNIKQENYKKISFLKLIKKYISKKIRSI